MNNDYQVKQAYAAETASRAYAGPGIGSRDMDGPPREKGPVGKAQETLGYLNELETLQRDIRVKLYGHFPESCDNNVKSPGDPSLEEMLQWICQRTALAVGDAKNLLSKLD